MKAKTDDFSLGGFKSSSMGTSHDRISPNISGGRISFRTAFDASMGGEEGSMGSISELRMKLRRVDKS